MDEPREEETPRQRSIRYWAPRVVAGLIGLGALVAGLWDSGRSTISFLADWSTFVIQAGAIYLFVFEREFLANLIFDLIDFVNRMRAYRERRAAERETARAARKASASATQEPTAGAPAVASPQSAPQTPPAPAPPPMPLPHAGATSIDEAPPRFRSRDSAFGIRAFVGVLVVALVGLVFWNPFGAGMLNKAREPDPVATPIVPQPPRDAAPSVPLPATPPPWTYTVREGDSCVGLGQRIHPNDAPRALAFCEQLQRENPDAELLPVRSRIRPGDHLTISADVPRVALEGDN